MSNFKIMKSSYPCSVSTVPLEYAKKFEAQALRNHMQTIDRLNERGGLDPVEFYAIAHGVCWSKVGKRPEECIEWLEKEFGLLKQLAQAQERIAELESQLEQQQFNNEHNLSIDQKVADRIKELEGHKEMLNKQIDGLEKEIEQKHSWVKHHRACVENALKDKHVATEKAKELEKKLKVAVEALNKIMNPGVVWVNSSKMLAKEALFKIEETKEEK